MITSLNSELWDWIAKQAGGKRIKSYQVVTGYDAPKWDYEPGVTHWKNHRPKSYDRCISEVTVGADWLAQRFPIQYAIARLQNSNHLHVTQQEITDAEKAWAEQEHLRRLADESARATVDLWQRIQTARQNRDCNPEEARLFTY